MTACRPEHLRRVARPIFRKQAIDRRAAADLHFKIGEEALHCPGTEASEMLEAALALQRLCETAGSECPRTRVFAPRAPAHGR